MKKRRPAVSLFQLSSSIFLVLTLLWLTVSTPFVYSGQETKKEATQKSSDENTSDDGNPFSNTTEEKSESGFNILSEYLHDTHHIEHVSTALATYYKCHPSDLYFAYHPELLSPPPEA